MKIAKEFYKEAKGYCDEAMDGVPESIFTIMESYASEKLSEQRRRIEELRDEYEQKQKVMYDLVDCAKGVYEKRRLMQKQDQFRGFVRNLTKILKEE